MIEILGKDAINQIADEALRSYAARAIKELSEEVAYPDDGCFVAIEFTHELETNPLRLTLCELPGLYDGLLDRIEIVIRQGDILELFIVINDGFWVSLILHKRLLNDVLLRKILDVENVEVS